MVAIGRECGGGKVIFGSWARRGCRAVSTDYGINSVAAASCFFARDCISITGSSDFRTYVSTIDFSLIILQLSKSWEFSVVRAPDLMRDSVISAIAFAGIYDRSKAT